MMKRRHFLWLGVMILFLYAAAVIRPAFEGIRTCGDSDESLEAFLEKFQQREVELLKVAETGHVKAVFYEREDLGTCIAFFDRRLFGLRWYYDGMDTLVDGGLQMEGSWRERGILGSQCEIVICGDNRSGAIGSYVLQDEPSIAREGLEADFILDIYILDGTEHRDLVRMRSSLQQFAPDGSEFIRKD